jgi:hypothetical protein
MGKGLAGFYVPASDRAIVDLNNKVFGGWLETHPQLWVNTRKIGQLAGFPGFRRWREGGSALPGL